MLVVTRLAKVPAGVKVGNQQYGGEQLNEQVWQWERRGKQVFIRVPSYSIKADKGTDMYESVKNSNLSSILASFDIKAYNKDTTGVVIDVTDFYNSDVMAIGATDAYIRKLILTQAALFAIVGFMIAFIFLLGFKNGMYQSGIVIDFSPGILFIILTVTFSISLFGAVFAIRRIKNVEPASVFRG